MELRHLRYFVAVAEAGSFLRAAGRLRVAQPALSKQIRDLEREIGVPLFERLPRGARLTPAGEHFLPGARNALESAARAVATARAADSATGLKFGHGDLYVYVPAVMRLLAAFRRAAPETPVRVLRMPDADQEAALRERRIDVAATFVGTWPVTGPGLEALQLVDCAITGVLLPASHPLAAQPRVRLHDLSDLMWLHPSPRRRPQLYRVLQTALESRGLVPARHRGHRGDAASNVPIAAGDAWMLANSAVAAVYPDLDESIVHRPFVEAPIPLWFALVWRSDAVSPLLETLVRVARESVALAGPRAGAAAAGTAPDGDRRAGREGPAPTNPRGALTGGRREPPQATPA
jgi:LysR family transcriptional regulator, benzoate and cis,cis-muconate-responsive activator of ben and cat genes